MADNPRLEDLKRRVLQDPASIAFAALADEYRRAGLFQEAIETCRAGLLRHPAYLSARVTLGRCLIEIGQHDEAQSHLEQVIRVAPDNLAAIRALADIHHKRGDAPYHYTPEPAPPPVVAAPEPAPAPARVVPIAARTPAAAVEPTAGPAAPAPPAAPAAAAAIVPAPALEPAIESHRAPEVQAPTATAAGLETNAVPQAPAPHPAQERLERFLSAIVRARASSSGSLHAAR